MPRTPLGELTAPQTPKLMGRGWLAFASVESWIRPCLRFLLRQLIGTKQNTTNARFMALVLISDEVVYNFYWYDYVNKLQKAERVTTGLGMKYADTDEVGECS